MGQARVAGAVDAVGVGVQLCAAAAASGVGDVAAECCEDSHQWRGAVQDGLWCILGRQRIPKAEGGNLDPELYVTWRRGGKANVSRVEILVFYFLISVDVLLLLRV